MYFAISSKGIFIYFFLKEKRNLKLSPWLMNPQLEYSFSPLFGTHICWRNAVSTNIDLAITLILIAIKCLSFSSNVFSFPHLERVGNRRTEEVRFCVLNLFLMAWWRFDYLFLLFWSRVIFLADLWDFMTYRS